MSKPLKVVSQYKPAGDQPTAIESLVQGVQAGLAAQTLLGVTGSGKTFTMAQVIEQTGRPAIIMAHNKTLAAQLYGEFKQFFPIMRWNILFLIMTTISLRRMWQHLTPLLIKMPLLMNTLSKCAFRPQKPFRAQTLHRATVSAIYGLGSPESYLQMILHVSRGQVIDQREILRTLARLQYSRNDVDFFRGQYRVKGDVIDIFPAESKRIRVELFDDEVERLSLFDPLTGVSAGSTLHRLSKNALCHSARTNFAACTILQ